MGHDRSAHLILLCGCVEAVLERDHIGVLHHLHDLQLPILEPLILQHLFNCHLRTATRTPLSAELLVQYHLMHTLNHTYV